MAWNRKEIAPAPTKTNGGERMLSASEHILEYCEALAERLEATGEDAVLIADGLRNECRAKAAFFREIGKRESKRCKSFYQGVQETSQGLETLRVTFASVFDDPVAQEAIDAAGELKAAVASSIGIEPPQQETVQ